MALCSSSACCIFLHIFFYVVIQTEYTAVADAKTSHILADNSPAAEFSQHKLIKPKIYHGREKRQITSTLDDSDKTHLHDVTLTYEVDGADYILDLSLNKDLITKGYFQKHQKDGKHVINRPTGKDVELCQYQGGLRGVPDSWAAVSTCHKGLSGVIFDGKELHYVEKVNGSDAGVDGEHYLLKHSDLNDAANKTCGYSSTTSAETHDILGNNEYNRILRYKRSTGSSHNVRGPYNANKKSRYVELVLVVDQQEYKSQSENLAKVNNRCKDIANIINALYAPLNIFIALVGVVVWTEVDEIKLSGDGDATLTHFLHYRRERLVKEHPNDNAQLLTRVQFDGGVVGKALKGPICTFEFSGGVSMDHSSTVGLVATTVAHEMGHNFGMEHDTSDCKCPEERCIMAPSSSSLSPRHWSSCSLEYLALAFEHGMDYCLRNKPERLFDSPVCGNGFVEPGEQCDCGLPDRCTNPCCSATTCMLHSNASCATGQCCDFNTCKPKTAGTMCRSADHECDLPEYCTGQSEYCPPDVYKMDTEVCDGEKAFCYQGSCRTRSDQCKILWGPSGRSSDDQCYTMNTKGSRHGNCGYNRLNQSYIKCDDENIFCGMLHCRHLNERLEFGMESVAILSHSFINSKGSIIPCRTAIVDLGLNQIDPGLAPDGAKCGFGKMCVNQKCMPVANLRLAKGAAACPGNCNGKGVCNSNGHCHCNDGFAPPLCDYPGPGGSDDSGPASDPNAHKDFAKVMYIIFLGVVPLTAIVALLFYYQRHNLKLTWPKTSTKTSKPAFSNPRGTSIFQTIPPSLDINQRNDDNSSLLPLNQNSAIHSNSFFGQFKGFSITPLHKAESTSPVSELKVPQRSAPPIPTAPTVPNVAIKSPKPVVRSNTTQYNKPVLSVKPTVTKTARPNSIAVNTATGDSSSSTGPTLPPLNPGANPRPLISSPVLENSTCTAKELISPLKNCAKVPVRPAPEVPLAIVPLSPVNKRPLSSPNSVVSSVSNEDVKKPKDGGGSALNRIASFLKSQKEDKNKNVPTSYSSLQRNPSNIKANKVLDKSVLKNIEISNPILQKETDISVSALPLEGASKDRNIVMRAQSMRGPASTAPRPAIHTFGSMRTTSHARRPTSIPVANRPTSPPPPRPPLPDAKKSHDETSEYQYDDCIAEGQAPLANISEETSPNSTDNIYAVIEESLPAKKGSSKDSTPSEYKSPRPLTDRSNSGSSESMGLLGEIVSEIQNRNFDSIYSTSTLARKKKEAAAKAKGEAVSKSDDDTDEKSSPGKDDALGSSDNSYYANTTSPIYKSPDSVYSNMNPQKSSASSTTSSGYLHPSAVNAPTKFQEAKIESACVKPAMSTFKGTDNDNKTGSASYKPFASTFNRQAGPLASIATTFKTNNNPAVKNNNPTTSTKKTPDEKPKVPSSPKTEKTLSRQTTPPNMKVTQKGNIKRQVTPPNLKKQTTPPNLKQQATGTQKLQPVRPVPAPPKNLPKPTPKTTTGPDVVTSCASVVTSKSPDVVSNASQKSEAPKPSVKPNLPTTKLVKQPSVPKRPVITKVNGDSKPSTAAKPVVVKNEQDSGPKTMPVGVRKAAVAKSNVASLQQKFEVNKPGANSNKPVISVNKSGKS